MGRWQGSYGSGSAAKEQKGINCDTCGYYNFGFRFMCKICKEKLQWPKTQERERQGKGYGKGSNTATPKPIENAWALRKLKESEERNKLLEQKLEESNGKAEQRNIGGEDAADLEPEDDPELIADLRNLDDIQKQHDQMVAIMGNEDRTVRDLKARLERARTNKRGKLSISAQIVTAEKRKSKLGKSIENARKAKEEAEKKRDEQEQKVQAEIKRISDLEAEKAKMDSELEALHKRALADNESKAGGENEETGKTDAGIAWNTLIEETKARVSYPGARPELAVEAEQIFTMLQTFLQQLPKQVFVISDANEKCTGETAQGHQSGMESCKGQENEGDDWNEEDFDAIEIDEVPGETEVQRKERKKVMCKQLRQVQGRMALRKKEKAKGVATKGADSKQKAGTDKEGSKGQEAK